MQNKTLRNLEASTPNSDRAERRTVDIVVPCFNEEKAVEKFYGALGEVLSEHRQYAFRILFVDDGSTDGTLDILRNLAATDERVEIVALSKNYGHQIALTAGIEHAQADAVITMDADLQHPPNLLPQMLEKWRSGREVISAVRKSTAGASWGKNKSSALFYFLFNRLSDTSILPGSADFVLLSRPAYLALRRMPERHRFLRGMISWIGFSRESIEFDAPLRVAGDSKYTLSKMVSLSLSAVFSFSSQPLRIATRVGVFFSLLALAYLLYVVAIFFTGNNVAPGWASTLGVVLLMGGIQLIFIGMAGEYLARIFEEVKGRPLYFTRQAPEARGAHADG